MTLHPHHYTLALLKHLLDKSAHTLFPPERLAKMQEEYAVLAANPAVPLETLEQIIARFGREVWPYHEALEELYRRHGRKKEEERVREKLTPATREKYAQFLAAGGTLADFRRGAEVELRFTPEEKFEIGQAVLDAHAATLLEIASSCRADKKNECEEVIADHQAKLARIEEKLKTLRTLAESSEKWRPEILDKIKTFEESFGYLTRTFHESDLDGTVDYYQGILASPELL